MSTILDLIKKKQLIEKQKEDKKKAFEENKNKFTYEKLDLIDYSELSNKVKNKKTNPNFKPIIFRPLDIEEIYATQILVDDKSKLSWVVWDTIQVEETFEDSKLLVKKLDTSNILYKLIKDIKKVEWVNNKAYEVHTGKECHQRITNNFLEKTLPNGNTFKGFPSQVLPSKPRYVIQGIDRNKSKDHYTKTGMLSMLIGNVSLYEKKLESGEINTIDYSEKGISYACYDEYVKKVSVLGTVEANKRDWAFWKDNNKYVVQNCKNEELILEFPKIPEIAYYGDTTEFELSLKKYDIEKYFQPTSLFFMKKFLSELFKLTDKDLGTKYYEELLDLTSKKEKSDNNVTDNTNVSPKTIDDDGREESNDITYEVKIEDSENFKKAFPKFNELNSEDKIKLLDKLEVIDDSLNPIYKPFTKKNDLGKDVWDDGKKLIPCHKECTNQINLPSNVMQCPKCSRKFGK